MMYVFNLIQMGNTIGSKLLSIPWSLLPHISCDPQYDPTFSNNIGISISSECIIFLLPS